MSSLKIVTIPNPILYQRSVEVEGFNRELRTLVNGMFDVMYDEDGVGLAAVQVGALKRVLVIDLREPDTKYVFVNPHLLESSDDMLDSEEGCLSIPGIVASLRRPRWVKVAYHNILGEGKTIETEGLMARALLHEMDHLDGKIYVDLLEPNIRREIQSDLSLLEAGQTINNMKVPNYRTEQIV